VDISWQEKVAINTILGLSAFALGAYIHFPLHHENIVRSFCSLPQLTHIPVLRTQWPKKHASDDRNGDIRAYEQTQTKSELEIVNN
jgi:hypothetical protein